MTRTRQAAVVGATLCLLAAAALVVALVRGPSTKPGTTQRASTAATAAAKTAVHDLLSYDYRTIGADITRAESRTTGRFAQDYAKTAAELRTEAGQTRAIVDATVGSTGVVSASPTQVVVLLFVDQVSVRQPAGAKTPTTRIDQSRVRVTMTDVGGHWLASQLDAL